MLSRLSRTCGAPPSRARRALMALWLTVAAVTFTLTAGGCGQKGPLVQPGAAAEQS